MTVFKNKKMYRELQKSDFNKSYLNLLKQLTDIGNISQNDFNIRFDLISDNKLHKIFVLEDHNKIISTGTLIIEPKFLHQCGNIGHIEDIVVDVEYKGKGLGKKMIKYLTDLAEDYACYKIILNCDEKIEKFYKKCGYEKKNTGMAKYFE